MHVRCPLSFIALVVLALSFVAIAPPTAQALSPFNPTEEATTIQAFMEGFRGHAAAPHPFTWEDRVSTLALSTRERAREAADVARHALADLRSTMASRQDCALSEEEARQQWEAKRMVKCLFTQARVLGEQLHALVLLQEDSLHHMLLSIVQQIGDETYEQMKAVLNALIPNNPPFLEATHDRFNTYYDTIFDGMTRQQLHDIVLGSPFFDKNKLYAALTIQHHISYEDFETAMTQGLTHQRQLSQAALDRWLNLVGPSMSNWLWLLKNLAESMSEDTPDDAEFIGALQATFTGWSNFWRELSESELEALQQPDAVFDIMGLQNYLKAEGITLYPELISELMLQRPM